MTETTRALVSRLAALLSNERAAFADFIVTLADFDRQRRWAEAGYANLYDFLVRELGMSKGTAFYRKVAVELVQRYPEVLEPLRDGRLCVTALYALSKAITPDNRAEVLPRFFHLSKQEAKVVAAEIAPAIEVPRRTAVTVASALGSLDLGQLPNRLGNCPISERAAPVTGTALVAPTAPPPRTTIEPLTAAACVARPSSPSSITSTGSNRGSRSRPRTFASAATRTTRSTRVGSTATRT